jgi:acyl-CoA synthetase (NDP forming)
MLIGRSERSQQAALSHTGSLTGDYAVARTLLQREGVLVPTTVDEMIDVIPLLLRNPRPKGDGIAFLTGSGAFKNLALDFAEDLGLRFPEFTPATVKRLQELIPGYSVAENPLDYSTISIKNPASVAEMIEAVAADTNCDALIVAHVAGSEMHQRNKAKYMLPPVANTDKPSGVAIMGDSNPLHPELVAAAIETGVPFYRSPERLMRAMALVRDLAKELAEPPESINPPSHRRTLGPFPFASGTGITEFEGKRWFRSLGLPVPDGDLASDLDDALRIARRIGFPVALKAQSPELTHKTEAGGVMLNVTSEGALRTAWSQLVDRVTTAQPNLKLTGVLIERMAQKGIELVVGARRDPMWGPVIMVGLGGIWVEALHDVRLLSPSVSRSRIKEELGKLRSAALLNGVRGQPPIDFEAVAEVVELVGGVMRDFPKIKEIDINPLMAYPSGALALDALVICDKSGEVAE